MDVRHVIFSLEKDRYGLPLDAVREIIVAPERYTRVPHAQDSMRGVMTLRGRVVPVVDLGRLLRLPGELLSGGRVVLLELSRRELGLLVSGVDGIENVEKVSSEAHTSRMVRGLARVGPLTITILDVAGLDAAVAASVANG